MDYAIGQWFRLYYHEWVKKEGLELIEGYAVEDVFTQPLKPWPRKGGLAVHILLEGAGELCSAYICEIPPAASLKPQKHLFEELIYILKGRGSTTVWYEGQEKRSFEWQAGSLFAIPLNARHQHFNGQGNEPARYLAVTTAPIMMNLIRDESFIFGSDAVFPDRYQGEANYFSGKAVKESYMGFGKPAEVINSNFVASIHDIPLNSMDRGVGALGVQFEMANGVLGAHLLEFPSGTFSKLHRHGPSAHVLWLSGEGYSLMWPEGGSKVKLAWNPGSVIVPPQWWWHQHCVTSRTPGRHLALKLSSFKRPVTKLHAGTLKSVREGGNQMEYDEVDPATMAEIKRIFAEECKKHGTAVRMP